MLSQTAEHALAGLSTIARDTIPRADLSPDKVQKALAALLKLCKEQQAEIDRLRKEVDVLLIRAIDPQGLDEVGREVVAVLGYTASRSEL